MSYDSLKNRTDTQLVTVLKIKTPVCRLRNAETNTFGTCGASNAIQQCYNTRNTCTSIADYDDTNSIKTYKFCGTGDFLFQHTASGGINDYIPLVDKLSITPSKLDYSFGLGLIANVKITLNDSTMLDSVDVDQYALERSGRSGYIEPTGTFWQRFRARNLYLSGKKIEVLTGFKRKDYPFDEADTIMRTYYISNFSPLNSNNQITITAKDPIALTKNDKAIAPMALGVRLTADVNNTTTTFPVEIDKSDPLTGTGYGLLSDEIVSFTHSITTGNLTVARGQLSTTAVNHSNGTELKIIYYTANASPELVIQDLLLNYVPNFDPNWINISEWTATINAFNTGYNLTAYISAPTGIDKLIGEICETCLLWFWWDEVNNKLQLKSVYPETLASTFPTIVDDDIIDIQINEISDKWFSRVAYYFAPRNKFDTAIKDMSRADVSFDTTIEIEQPLIKQIATRWLDSGDALTAADASYKLMKTTSKRPLEFKMTLDISNNFIIGDTFFLKVKEHTDYTGNPVTVQLRVASVKENISTGQLNIIAFPINVGLRSFRLCPDSYTESYTSMKANNPDNEEKYGWLCDDATGLLSNGDKPYTYT